MRPPDHFVLVTLRTALTPASDEIYYFDAEAPYQNPQFTFGQTAFAVLFDDFDRPTKFELVSYSKNEFNRLRRLTRGVGGTTAQSWAVGAYIAQDLTAEMAEIIAQDGASGEALVSGLSALRFDTLDYRSVAGKPAFAEQRLYDGQASATTPASGQATVYYNSSSEALKCKFDTGIENDIVVKT